jgi:acetyltransferase-like isoleucine patch superfamily enzyme
LDLRYIENYFSESPGGCILNITLNKIVKKTLRSISKSSFVPNNVRINLLRQAGVHIGNEVIINEGITLACDIGYESNLTIEDRVAFGPNVTIVISSHPNHSRLRNLKDKYPNFEIFGKVTIMHDSWIGAGAIILPGVTVREYSIVGAGGVVTEDIPPFSVVAGVPAKIIRKIEHRETIP